MKAFFSKPVFDDLGILRKVDFDGKNALAGFGVETNDGLNPFLWEEPRSLNRMQLIEKKIGKSESASKYRVDLPTARFWFQSIVSVRRKQITHRVKAHFLNDCFLEDFSLRFAFKKWFAEKALVGSEWVQFHGHYVNHQHETNLVQLIQPDRVARIEFKVFKNDSKMVPTMYVRPFSPTGWVVHARLFPKQFDSTIVKLARPFWDKRIPWIEPLTWIPPIQKALWYAGERSNKTVNTLGFHSLGVQFIPRHAELDLEMSVNLIEGRSP